MSGRLIGILAFLGFFLVICVFLISQVLLLVNRKPGVKLFQARLLYFPFMMQFRASYYLTKKGVFWRNVSWVSYVVAWVWIWIAIRPSF